ncbi:MAG: pyridoxal phosphate-dependent aminotransferase [Clostridia bacterium]|nr:pyridoxal phosphate-dependent aminotransferase [Clostridia bacterium]
MKYDFDTPVDRRGTDSLKWDVGENELPMWVADMDFKAAPEIRAALKRRLDHGVFGYSDVPDAWYGAYIGWWERRHGFAMKKEELIFCTGAVPAISSMVRRLTAPNENVVLLTPVYNIFFNSIINNGARVLECPLKNEAGSYSVDFPALEKALADPQTTLMILCNPQNPVGKIWDRETLARIGALARQYHVAVISDELHCDLTEPGTEYVPFLSASEDCRAVGIACLSPSKAFNLAGMQSAAVCVPDPFLRHKVRRGLNTDEVAEPNALAVPAAVAAFTAGEPWLDALREYLSLNRKTAEAFIGRDLPAVRVTPQNATYLLWLDVSAVSPDGEALAAHIREKTGLYLIGGEAYGKAGKGFLRMNIACPRAALEDGLARLKDGIDKY